MNFFDGAASVASTGVHSHHSGGKRPSKSRFSRSMTRVCLLMFNASKT